MLEEAAIEVTSALSACISFVVFRVHHRIKVLLYFFLSCYCSRVGIEGVLLYIVEKLGHLWSITRCTLLLLLGYATLWHVGHEHGLGG